MTGEPTRIGRYDIVSVLGRGAMGVVYCGHDPDIDRAVAIKLVHSHLLSGEEQEDFIARFRREAQAAARCAHTNVVAVYDYALHEGSPFLVMEFVDGMSLASMRQAGAMRPAEAVQIVRQVLAGLGAAHASGIVHRDVKPANVMITRGGVAKVADFGISRIENSALTATGMMVGTPNYMSPEQCRGETADARSDLYSVGVILYELLAGTRPFAGSSSGALYVRLSTEDAPDIRRHVPDLPEGLARVVMRSLARDPAARFASAEAMAEALAGEADGLRGGAPPPADRTLVLPGRAALSESGSRIAPELVATLERRLAERLGPIARYLVQSAVVQAPDFESLCRKLAENIEAPEERDRFVRDMLHRSAGSTTLASAATTIGPAAVIEPAQLERLQAALARHVGPVARVLIKRAKARTLGELWREMATHVEDPAERARFLRDAPPGS